MGPLTDQLQWGRSHTAAEDLSCRCESSSAIRAQCKLRRLAPADRALGWTGTGTSGRFMGYRHFYCACDFCRFDGCGRFGDGAFEEPHNHSRLYHRTISASKSLHTSHRS